MKYKTWSEWKVVREGLRDDLIKRRVGPERPRYAAQPLNSPEPPTEISYCSGCYGSFPYDDMVVVQTGHDDLHNYCKGCAPAVVAKLEAEGKPYRVR